MKKLILVSCLIISLVATLFAAAPTAQAAPLIRIFKDASSQEGVSSFTIPADAGGASWRVFIALSEAPEEPVNVGVSHEGRVTIFWAGSDDLTFTQDDWNRRRPLILEYQERENAVEGERGRITLSADGVPSREILVTLTAPTGGGGVATPVEETEQQGGAGSNQPSASGSQSSTGLAFIRGGIIPECLRDPEKSATQGIECVTDSITHFTQLLLFLVAISAFIYLLYGGFLYASAFGDENKVTQGKKTITYALIGVVIAILSSALVQLLRQVLGA